MFSKVLVANRAEIAVRAFRAAYELGAKTVAVYPLEDRMSEHRVKADEAYLIGVEGHPIKAYLDIDEMIRVAKLSGADAIYPGYGFLSENVEFARRCAEEGITFIGPPPEVLASAGDKVAALKAARAAGVPVLHVLGAVSRSRGDHRGRRRNWLPHLRQGGRWRRRSRHAPRGDA